MAFTDLNEALGELGYAGTWQDQAEGAEAERRAKITADGARVKWGAHLPKKRSVRATQNARHYAKHRAEILRQKKTKNAHRREMYARKKSQCLPELSPIRSTRSNARSAAPGHPTIRG